MGMVSSFKTTEEPSITWSSALRVGFVCSIGHSNSRNPTLDRRLAWCDSDLLWNQRAAATDYMELRYCDS